MLGVAYEQGLGLKQDYQQAKTWYEKAAGQGNADAQFYLGSLYASGKVTPAPDYQQAKTWYEKAAGQGQSGAQVNLGVMYAMGNSVPKDYTEAYKWFSLAGPSGNREAIINLKKLETLMKPEQIAEGKKRLAEWRPTSSGK
jgi:TPR repeat protein